MCVCLFVCRFFVCVCLFVLLAHGLSLLGPTQHHKKQQSGLKVSCLTLSCAGCRAKHGCWASGVCGHWWRAPVHLGGSTSHYVKLVVSTCVILVVHVFLTYGLLVSLLRWKVLLTRNTHFAQWRGEWYTLDAAGQWEDRKLRQ